MTGSVQMLAGIVLVDLGAGMAPALVTKFFIENGARVIRVPPVGGDPFGKIYPADGIWRAGSVIDEAAAQSAAKLDRLLASADVCLLGGEDYPGLSRRTDGAAIAARHPNLIILNIEGYPSGADDQGRPATDLLVQARSGIAYEQYGARPLLMSFEPSNYGAALQGLIGVLAALCEREASGRGQMVSTSLFEGALAWTRMFWGSFEKPTRLTQAVMPKDPHPLIFRCADGCYVHFTTGAAGSKYMLYQALGIDDPTISTTDPGLPNLSGDPRNFFGPVDLYAEHAAKFTSTVLLERLRKAGLPAEPVLPPGGCWDDPQIVLNGVIATAPDGTRHVGSPIVVSSTTGPGRGPAVSGARPLEGRRVLDFGAFVAGPLASAALADLGADVIKVEPFGGEASRATLFRAFNAGNRGKRGFVLNLKDRASGQLIEKLARTADAVTSNFRPGASARLGIDASTLHRINPRLVLLESPAYGSTGPLAGRAGFDMVMQAFCGHESHGGGDGNPPLWNRLTMVDFAAGMIGSVALLAGMFHQARTGEGAALETALVNSGIYLFSHLIQRADGKFEGVPLLNSERTGYHPAEAFYQCADGWIAVAARGQEAATRLAMSLDLQEKVDDDSRCWGPQEARRIAAALAPLRCEEALARLGSAEVWAERCRDDAEREVLADASLHAIGTVRTTQHPTFGQITEIGSLIRFSRSSVGSDRSAPLLGDSTRDVLRDIGLEAAAIDRLFEAGMVA